MRFPLDRLALALALLPLVAPAAAGDPLKSAACGEALAALRDARAAGAEVGEALRARAARVCLGSSGLPGPPARLTQAPLAVPPPLLAPPPATAAPLPRLAAPAPPVAIGRPPLPAHCDGGGCWSSDGERLHHLPPNLAVPGGPCVPQGGLVYCP